VPRGFSRERAASECFARAVDEPSDDGDFAEVLAVIGRLRALGDAGSPDEETRRRIRAEIVERLGPAGEDEKEPLQDGRRHALAGVLAAAAAVLLALAGLGMVLSKDALPGDPLYGVKRVGESATLKLTFGQQAKAEKHLEFAGNRIDELAGLKKSDGDSGDYLTGLADFGSDARAGVAQLIELATRSGGRQQLAELRTWAEQRDRKLATEQAAVPSAAASRFAGAQSLLTAIETRATALTDRLGCYQITSGSSDELGALPAQSPCEPEPMTRADVPPAEDAPVLSQPAGSPAQSPVAPTSGRASPAPTTAARPTDPLPPVSSGPLPPPVVQPPILPTTGPRLPSLPQPSSPLVSIPPLLPGLPTIVIP
jgi:hypothetical protein